MKHEGMAGANLLWLADALAVDGPALARMDISIEEDVALCEQTLRLIGKACPAATRYAGESLETFLQEKRRPEYLRSGMRIIQPCCFAACWNWQPFYQEQTARRSSS